MNDRLAPQAGEWIDRTRPIDFKFEGRSYTGFAGDVLASALWANGVRFTGRSFKYHRPRGIYSLANHDANFLVATKTRTNLRGDTLPLVDGLDVRAVNTWGGLAKDRLNVTERFAKLLPVGFYYKGFHTPRRLFPFYEKQMRQVAGLGKLDPQWISRSTPKDYAFCDLLVIGAGPAGLSAALAAADQGADVLVVDETATAGGSLNWQWTGDPRHGDTLESLVQRAELHERIRLRLSTQAAGCYTDHWVALVDHRRLTKLRARALLVASGCVEQPAVFQNNDLPGVLLGSAAQRLIHQYAIRPFGQAVVLAGNLDGYRVAMDLLQCGVDVRAIVDLSTERKGDLIVAAEELGIRVLRGYGVYEARPARDKKGLVGVVAGPLDAQGRLETSQTETIACDGLAVSVGWAPTSDLLYQAGTRFGYDHSLEQLIPTSVPAGVFVAGRVRGVFDLEDQLEDGKHAGLRASKQLGFASAGSDDAGPLVDVAGVDVAGVDVAGVDVAGVDVAAVDVAAVDVAAVDVAAVDVAAEPHSHPYPIFAHRGKKNFVDFDEDLHLADFKNAHQEGYDNVELLKRYSTVGMGPSQGKLSNQNAVRILARLNEATIDQTGTTTSRPFHHPVSMEHLAGRRFHPERRTPMHRWHAEHGAQFTRVGGGWLRPEYYDHEGLNAADCILGEAKHVRSAVGLMDLGTLGKIHVSGPDSVELLNRVYTGSFTKQVTGTLRYGLACDESGVVIEDGIVARWADDRFYLSATSSGSAAFFRELQRWALLWQLDVTLINLTGQYTAMNVAGPKSRQVMASVCDADLSSEACPFSSARQAIIAGHRAMIMRVGFVGEVSYEIHLPASQGMSVWSRLMEAGKSSGIRPFGVECQRLLRLEKGHLIVGQDTDALTTPLHLGMDRLPRGKKKFFVGKRSLQITQHQTLDRLLVGICFDPNDQGPLPDECCLVIHHDEIAGRVTSIARRTTLGHAIGLAFVAPELAQPGTRLSIRTSSGAMASCQVAETPFYDPDNERQGSG